METAYKYLITTARTSVFFGSGFTVPLYQTERNDGRAAQCPHCACPYLYSPVSSEGGSIGGRVITAHACRYDKTINADLKEQYTVKALLCIEDGVPRCFSNN